MIEALSIIFVLAGLAFFLAGTVGLLRLPELFSRLHALTKADSLGLGFVVAGLALHAPGLFAAAKLVAVWLLAMLSAATIAQLLAIHGVREDTQAEEGE